MGCCPGCQAGCSCEALRKKVWSLCWLAGRSPGRPGGLAGLQAWLAGFCDRVWRSVAACPNSDTLDTGGVGGFSGCHQHVQDAPNMFRMSSTFLGCPLTFLGCPHVSRCSNIFRFVRTCSDFPTFSDCVGPDGAVGPYFPVVGVGPGCDAGPGQGPCCNEANLDFLPTPTQTDLAIVPDSAE